MYGAFAFKLFPAELIEHFTKHSGQVNSIAFTPDEKHAASASSDETVKIWDFLSGHQARTFYQADLDRTDPGGNYANAVTVSRDGKKLLSGGSSKLLWLWNSRKTDEPIFVLRGSQIRYLDHSILLGRLLGCEWKQERDHLLESP